MELIRKAEMFIQLLLIVVCIWLFFTNQPVWMMTLAGTALVVVFLLFIMLKHRPEQREIRNEMEKLQFKEEPSDIGKVYKKMNGNDEVSLQYVHNVDGESLWELWIANKGDVKFKIDGMNTILGPKDEEIEKRIGNEAMNLAKKTKIRTIEVNREKIVVKLGVIHKNEVFALLSRMEQTAFAIRQYLKSTEK